MTTRRTFLGVLTATGIGAAVSRALPVSAAVPVAQRVARPDVPDVGGFLRLGGWAVCVPPQEWANNGAWVIDGVMAALQPARWHTWGIWPATNTTNRVPGIFSDQYFNRPAVRQYLTANPGREWISFNEPEISSREKMMPSLAVGDAMTPEFMSPQLAVDVTLEFIDMGREVGNEFQFMSPNVTLNTSNDGLGWLTEYMSIMRRKKMYMRPSSWGIHPYNCNTVAALRQSMAKWWTWHEVWGSGAPCVIGEICAEDAPVSVQIEVMNEARRLLDAGDVLGVTWASAYQDREDGVPWPNYHLGVLNHETQTYELTDLGWRWKALQ